jgi:hypothetical protein
VQLSERDMAKEEEKGLRNVGCVARVVGRGEVGPVRRCVVNLETRMSKLYGKNTWGGGLGCSI